MQHSWTPCTYPISLQLPSSYIGICKQRCINAKCVERIHLPLACVQVITPRVCTGYAWTVDVTCRALNTLFSKKCFLNKVDGIRSRHRCIWAGATTKVWHIYFMKLHGSSMVQIGVSTKTKNMHLVIVPSLKIYCFEAEVVQLDNNETCEFKIRSPKLSSEHPYPTTKIMFIPDKDARKQICWQQLVFFGTYGRRSSSLAMKIVCLTSTKINTACSLIFLECLASAFALLSSSKSLSCTHLHSYQVVISQYHLM